MASILVACLLVVTVHAAKPCYNEDVLTVPSSICGSTEVNVPVCNAVSALRLCSNITVNGVARDGESYLMELASNGTADGPGKLVVMSSQVVRVLAGDVFLSSTVIARAIVELTQQFGWSRITIVADIADAYFLHTAEQLYTIANLSADSSLLQLKDSDSEIEDLVNKVDRLNLRIVVLSLRPRLVCKILRRARERHLVWPEYAWIVHSVEVSEESCGDNSTLDGVITIRLKNSPHASRFYVYNCSSDVNKHLRAANIQYLDSCSISSASQQGVLLEQIGKQTSMNNETGIPKSLPYPSDLPPQYVATVYIALFYTATTVCFIICTIMLVLYVCFRNEPAVKATSVSLSMLIFIGCYLIILYLYVLNSSLLPSFHKQRDQLRNSMCTLRTTLNGVGFPVALILSTLLVKLLRVYRLFRLKRRVSRFTTSNLALAACVLLITIPNALISLIWSTFDPYTSVVLSAIRNGFLHISVLCVSAHTLRWPLLLLVYISILSLLLITFAVLTRKIKYQDFKDTKKVNVLSFLLVFTCATALFYWYLLRILAADVILVHAVLQTGYYCIILECQGLIFAPKLFPIVKEKMMRRYCRVANTPAPKK